MISLKEEAAIKIMLLDSILILVKEHNLDSFHHVMGVIQNYRDSAVLLTEMTSEQYEIDAKGKDNE